MKVTFPVATLPNILRMFLESKEEEITLIIRDHITEAPSNIAKAIICHLDLEQLPMSLLVNQN